MSLSLPTAFPPARKRGAILAALKLQYPHPMTEIMLDMALGGMYAGDQTSYVTDIALLKETGRITQERTKTQGMVIQVFRLTAGGMRLLERGEVDPLVEVPE